MLIEDVVVHARNRKTAIRTSSNETTWQLVDAVASTSFRWIRRLPLMAKRGYSDLLRSRTHRTNMEPYFVYDALIVLQQSAGQVRLQLVSLEIRPHRKGSDTRAAVIQGFLLRKRIRVIPNFRVKRFGSPLENLISDLNLVISGE